MIANLKCPKCQADIPISEAFREEMLAEEHARHTKELDEVRAAAATQAAQAANQNYQAREAQLATEFRLKELEKDKRLNDALTQIEELKRKIQQGPQQLQGEVLELELERLLRDEFHDDEIIEVKKGQRGGDVIQKVRNRLGRVCGTILWETKNAKWQPAWLPKLRSDQRDAKADLAVLVATEAPAGIDVFAEREHVWIVQLPYAKALALMLRRSLLELADERSNQAGKGEKMEALYQYLTSVEFRQRIQAMAEGFNYLLKDVEAEKRWFAKKWAQQEKEIRKIVENTHGMYGDLQGVTGRSLIAIPALETPAAL